MNKNISLILSSGGARGMAHIGVIQALEKEGFHIKSIAGSSIGALVGAFYASGQLDLYKDWVCNLDKIDVFKLMDFTFSTQGFIKGEKVFNELKKIIKDENIEDLPIAFTATATDLSDKKEIFIRKGSMYEAIRASLAVPTVLTPYYKDGHELVDGGVMNPIPVNGLKRTANDVLVIVNLNAHIPYTKPQKQKSIRKEDTYSKHAARIAEKWRKVFPPSGINTQKKSGYIDLLSHSIDMMQDKLSKLTVASSKPDIYVPISKEACGLFEFYKASEMIAEGERAFKLALKNNHDGSK